MENIIGKYLSCVADYIEANGVQKAFLFSTIQQSTIEKERLFNSESGSKDAGGKGLGSYSNPYGKRRERLGFQSKVKDLERTGDLRRSIKEDIVNGKVIVYIDKSTSTNGITNRKKAGYITTYQKRKGNTAIFRFTESAQDKVFELGREIITEDIKQIANECT